MTTFTQNQLYMFLRMILNYRQSHRRTRLHDPLQSLLFHRFLVYANILHKGGPITYRIFPLTSLQRNLLGPGRFSHLQKKFEQRHKIIFFSYIALTMDFLPRAKEVPTLLVYSILLLRVPYQLARAPRRVYPSLLRYRYPSVIGSGLQPSNQGLV